MAALAVIAGGLGAHAAPGDVLYSDIFDDGGGCSALAPWTTTNTNFGGTSTQASNSGSCSLFTAGGDLTANLLQMIVASVGLVSLIVSSRSFFVVVKWAGVA